MHLLYYIVCTLSDVLTVQYCSHLTVFKTDSKILYNLNAVRAAQ